jgi:hypothetical protein
VTVNCIVGRGKKRGAIEPIESGDKPCALEEMKEGGVIWILRELVNKCAFGRVESGLWVGSGKRVREKRKEGEGNEGEEHLCIDCGRKGELCVI